MTMRGVTVRLRESDARSIDLRDILAAIGPSVRGAAWSIRGAECVGAAADALHLVCDRGTDVDGVSLADLAAGVDQTIEGEFIARLPHAAEPWIIVRAIDGAAFDVLSDDRDVLAAIDRSFENVFELPG